MKPVVRPVSRAESRLSLEGNDQLRALGLAIRAARTSLGITREQHAAKMLIGSQTLRRMELGDPRVSIGYYLAVAEGLHVPFLDTAGLLELTSTIRHPTSRASRKRTNTDRFG